MFAIGPANRGDPAQMILRLLAVALLDLPQTVILPGQHMIRIGLQRALVPDLAQPVVAELAIGIADQIGDVGIVVMAQRLELPDRSPIVVAVIDRGIGGAVSCNEGRGAEEGLLGLLGLVARLGGRGFRGGAGVGGRRIAAATTASAGG